MDGSLVLARPRYWVTTWDVEAQEFTPQPGVPPGPYTLWGLRGALRALRELGYGCRGGDPSVLVEELGGREGAPPAKTADGEGV